MIYQNLRDLWLAEEKASFEGWDFSYLTERYASEELPWDYKCLLKNYLQPFYKMLDMGTGGGEFLLTLSHPYQNTFVTESWEPNIQLCKQRLAPLGITVVAVLPDDELPLPNNMFDMVINRHESYNVAEVKRILKPNGIFITQQVGGLNNIELAKRLIPEHSRQYAEFSLATEINKFQEANFEILYHDEAYPRSKYYDIGALVYFAKIINWEFPGFSVDRCLPILLQMHTELCEKGYIESTEHRFIIVAQKTL